MLIWHAGALGDLVSLFPLIKTLRQRFQPLAIVCRSSVGKLAAAEGLVDTWYPIEAAWTASLFSREPSAEALRILSPFISLLVFSSSEALGSCLQGIAGARIYRLSPRPPTGRPVHIADYVKECFSSWGLFTQVPDESADVQGTSCAPERGAEPRVFLIHPGAGSSRKVWPLERFLEVAEHLRRHGDIPQFVIGPAEKDLEGTIKRTEIECHRPVDCLELIALLRSASAYIGNDSGVSHLAAWVGLPSVVIFGPSDPLRWAPRGRRVQVLRPPVDCRACFETMAENCETSDCLMRIGPDRVLAACQRVARNR
jgi:ADP-heptose:LPS heptosyltransferase